MSALGILYPSFSLASMADPLDPYYRRSGGRLPSQGELIHAIELRLAPVLTEVVRRNVGTDAGGAADERWYWAAPILLDAFENNSLTLAWLSRPDAPNRWIG